jgi:predicted 3-demethylubiquinone-9 3-methyltransferase (glyoxalase superfamily)
VRRRTAAEFPARTFPSRRHAVHRTPSDYPGGSAGNELTVELAVLGRSFVGLNGGPSFVPNDAVSFMVLTDDQAQTDRYWNAILDNGGGVKAGADSPGNSRLEPCWKRCTATTRPLRSVRWQR